MLQQELIKKYRDKGLKLTPQRLAILECLDGNVTHPTAEEILKDIRKKNPTISFATVYNTLQALKERGELLELTIDPVRKHYDPDTSPHHHVICSDCGVIGDIFEDYSAHLALPGEIEERFTITGNAVNFYGRCQTCVESGPEGQQQR